MYVCMYVLFIGVLEVPFSQGLCRRKFDSAISADDHYDTSAAPFFSSKLYSYCIFICSLSLEHVLEEFLPEETNDR